MFDISWSELLILAVVTLIFVGPKELPRFLGTLGRYAGILRRQANEFRRIFDEAMREAELDDIKKGVEGLRDGVSSSLRDAEQQAKAGLDAGSLKPNSTSPASAPPSSPPQTDVMPQVAANVAKPEPTVDAQGVVGDASGKVEGPH